MLNSFLLVLVLLLLLLNLLRQGLKLASNSPRPPWLGFPSTWNPRSRFQILSQLFIKNIINSCELRAPNHEGGGLKGLSGLPDACTVLAWGLCLEQGESQLRLKLWLHNQPDHGWAAANDPEGADSLLHVVPDFTQVSWPWMLIMLSGRREMRTMTS